MKLPILNQTAIKFQLYHKGKNMKNHFIKHSLLAVLILANVTFAGCFPTGKTTTNEPANTAADINSDGDSSSAETVPKHLDEKLLDKLEINADINFPDDAKWKTYSATPKKFSEEELNNAFLNEKTIKDKYENQLYENRDDLSIIYNFSDDTSLIVQTGMITYSHPEYDHRYMITDDDFGNFIRPDIADLYTETSLDGIDREQSVDLVKGKLSALGVSVSDTPEVYALNYDTFKNMWEDYEEKDGTPAKPWDKDDEAYLIIFKEQAEALPITGEGYVNAENGVSTSGGRIYGLVSKSGLIYLNLSGIYEISEPSTEVNLISFNTAKEVVKEKYNNIILSSTILISEVTVELIPVHSSIDKAELVPTWIFTASQEQTFSDEKGIYTKASKFPVFVNGKTGDEIRIGGTI
jgi:hypothetical protein